MRTSTARSPRRCVVGASTRSQRPRPDDLGESDESQLAWATDHDRSLVTFNVGHFAHMHGVWLRANRHHAGIIVSSQQTIVELLRRLKRLSVAVDAETLCDRLEFLGDWR